MGRERRPLSHHIGEMARELRWASAAVLAGVYGILLKPLPLGLRRIA